jgi:hypothetical protein
VRVSRHHFQIAASPTGATLRVLPGARPLTYEDRNQELVELPVDGAFRVGDTEFSLVLHNDESSTQPGSAFSIDTQTLLTGPGAEVGFAALFALAERLDDVESREGLESAVREWSQRFLGATDVLLRDEGGIENSPLRSAMVTAPNAVHDVRSDEGATIFGVPAHTRERHWLTVILPGARDRADDGSRRLLVLAGKLCASRLGTLQMRHVVSEDREALRRIAIGSAREFIGVSQLARDLEERIVRVAPADITVLLQGETGTGKSFVARLLHERSHRASEPFKTVNCAALPEHLIEAELFGTEKGAFTGAASRAGLFEAAGRGTIFLDEIAELPLHIQAKLLRVLEEREFERLGSTRTRRVDARVVAATNQKLEALVEAKRFREDLFFRVRGSPASCAKSSPMRSSFVRAPQSSCRICPSDCARRPFSKS